MKTLKIIQARYGPIEYGQWVDVMPVVQTALFENGLSLTVSDSVLLNSENPWPTKVSKLRMKYLLNDKEFVAEKFSGAQLRIEGRPDNWEEILYAQRKPRTITATNSTSAVVGEADAGRDVAGILDVETNQSVSLKIHSAKYGVNADEWIDVTQRLQSLVKDNSLDIVVNNSTITPNQNPFRGKGKVLSVVYSIDGSEQMLIQREEKDWLIIGPVQKPEISASLKTMPDISSALSSVPSISASPMTATTLNDYLIRKFSISPQRLRGPMPIEVPQFHRNDLAQLFAEMGFKRGAEIGVAEGNYSEVLLKANPECQLLLVDPWHHYSENPQGKSKEKHEFALNEVYRKTAGYKVLIYQENSMDAIQQVPDVPIDFVYIDGNHLFDFVMQDLIEWSKRVRSGGIVSGDDYYALDQKRWVGGGVVEAVQAYTNAHRIPIWFLFQGHKSVDFMWVKP